MQKTRTSKPDPLAIARGFMESRVVLTAVELDIFAKIEEGANTIGRLAEALRTHLRPTERLLNALAGIGLLVKKEDGSFHNTQETRQSLVPGKPGYMGDALKHSVYLWDSWSTLTQVMRTGRPVEPAVEKWSGGRAEAFMGAMECIARRRAPLVAERVDLSGAKRLLDIGGGPATYSIEFCTRCPKLKATVFDLPQVVRISKQRIAEAGLADRISTQAGNYHVDELGGGYDAALLFSILHSNGPNENRRLLSKTFRALNPGGWVLIQEFLVDDSKTRPAFAALFGVNMLVNTGHGDVYSETEIRQWLEEAGFVKTERLEDVEGGELLIARKPPV